LLDPPVGPSVDDLVTALSELDGFEATEPADVTIDGYSGKRFQLTAPSAPTCELTDAGLGTWFSSARTNGVGPGELNEILILDVGGERVMIAGAWHPGETPSDVVTEQLLPMINSIRLGP
jgi:hypothetical protein